MKKDHLEIILEDIQSKFELVLEGHDALRKEIRDAREESNQKHDHTAFLIQVLNKKTDEVDARLSKKLDDVAAELAAHWRDTEAHRAGYGISEKED